MKKAFTLSEVLITLGIIGVVAALTIPSVIKNYQQKQTAIMLRRAYANLQNAIRMSVAENSDIVNWKFPPTSGDNRSQNYEFAETYFLPYFKSAKLYTDNEMIQKYPSYRYTYSFDGVEHQLWGPRLVCIDGTIYSFSVQNNYIWINIDINGIKGPNKMGRDIFVAGSVLPDLKNRNSIRFWGSDATVLNSTTDFYGCNKQLTGGYAGFYCGAWIEKNNWEIPDDYPW